MVRGSECSFFVVVVNHIREVITPGEKSVWATHRANPESSGQDSSSESSHGYANSYFSEVPHLLYILENEIHGYSYLGDKPGTPKW